MSYSEFNGLLVLAIGCNIAYSIKPNKEAIFFKLLDLINFTENKIEKFYKENIYKNETIGDLLTIQKFIKKLKEHSIREIEIFFGKEYHEVLKAINLTTEQ